MIIVPTIRNSGSHFVLKLLGAEQPWRHKGILSWRTPGRTKDSIIFDHVFPHQKELYLPLIADPENITIVPLRHPYLTEKSWIDRGFETGDLIDMWSVMVEWIAPLKPNFLPLDVPSRESWLSALNSRTGLSLRTDWRPEGSKSGNSGLTFQDCKPSEQFIALAEVYKDFLGQFYEETS